MSDAGSSQRSPRAQGRPGKRRFSSDEAGADDTDWGLAMSHYCQNCQKAAASVTVTDVVNGKAIDRHLCEECAESEGVSQKVQPQSMMEVFEQLLEKTGASRARDKQCEGCRMSFSEFKAKGRFGCSQCYTTFLSRVVPLLERIHGSADHVTQSGAAEGGEAKARPEPPQIDPPQIDPPQIDPAVERLTRLREELQEAIEREDYEQAAALRDQIKAAEGAES